ncbi:MAG: pyrroloquinoline quinone biosynthesis protein PqqE [Acidobacteriaceae bacterium]|nr:pyrroloquinoline quinone biosynthesis protein PqqE [Acidobacteriaceae bacterium]MBV9781290.1 pyrroloquinoline quinone biosynthesis protein PqqE [Acidobacteriaceae bacterium]
MIAPPQALIAEVTHRCPMHCVYCSNPLEMQSADRELSTDAWTAIIRDAAGLGCFHLHLTGGEPLSRKDVEQLVRVARDAGLYTNLITSGLGLSRARLKDLVAAGLDHIQLSFQDSVEETANAIGGARAHAYKLRVASWIREHRLAFTVNAVVHRHNLDRLQEFIGLAEQLNADKLEIANVQYYGWAFRNRDYLMPTRAQVAKSLPIVVAAQERLKGKMRIDFVLPDYYAKYPKPCMGGWGRKLILIDPAGRVMPCHAAGVIPGLQFENAQDKPLRFIWEQSDAFQCFRGDEWMQEPCRSCERKGIDFGGCRCQAFLLTGDATATDPTCSKAPERSAVDEAVSKANRDDQLNQLPRGDWVYRIDPVMRA